MDQRLSFVTLIVRDLGKTREFYVRGLGWEPEVEADEVLMFRVADKVVLSLWAAEAAAAELGSMPALGGTPPITLSHNVATNQGVDRVLETARTLGADVWDAEEREWGGYSGYFTDPDGFRWEICQNPQEIGQSILP